MSEMVGRWTRGIEPDNRTIQEQQLTIKLAERDALLREVVLNHSISIAENNMTRQPAELIRLITRAIGEVEK